MLSLFMDLHKTTSNHKYICSSNWTIPTACGVSLTEKFHSTFPFNISSVDVASEHKVCFYLYFLSGLKKFNSFIIGVGIGPGFEKCFD